MLLTHAWSIFFLPSLPPDLLEFSFESPPAFIHFPPQHKEFISGFTVLSWEKQPMQSNIKLILSGRLCVNTVFKFINLPTNIKKKLVLSPAASESAIYVSTVGQLSAASNTASLLNMIKITFLMTMTFFFNQLSANHNIRQVLYNLDKQKPSQFCLPLQQYFVLDTTVIISVY